MPYSLSRLAMWTIIATLPLLILPRLPTARYDAIAIVLACLLLMSGGKRAKDIAILLLLFIWGAIAARTLTWQIDALTGKSSEVIVNVEQVLPDSERIKLRVTSLAGKPVFPPISVLVSTKGMADSFCSGQKWQMTLNLRPVHARLNEGGFDAQRFAVANGTPLTGRILSLQALNSECGWRQKVIQRSRAIYGELRWQALLSALAFGERGDLSKEIAQLLRETGTAHLMAISGMHISLAASVGWLFARGIQLGFPTHRIGYRFPLFCGLLVALTYTWLSGYNPPAIRAMLAISLWYMIRLSGMRCDNWQVWGICVASILFFDPLSILSESLWLSAIAVAGLMLWFSWFPLPWRFSHKKRWLLLQLLHLQLGLFLLLMPVQMLIFHGISLSALLANLWAVPVVTLVTVPLILCALASLPVPHLNQLLWWLADCSLQSVFTPLRHLPAGWLELNYHAFLLSFLAWTGILAWRFCWWRTSPAAVLGLCLSIACWRLNAVKPEWRMDMLDIGHGLAVVISTQGEALIYDTGNRWPGGDAAQSQILPWLRWQGLELKHIILSHEHLDHIGGFETLHSAFPGATVHRGRGGNGEQPCEEGISWRWQQLSFDVLWPPPGQKEAGNNQSCVIKISDGKRQVLLTGDIEARAELDLVRLKREKLRADILQVPHHGSNTSSVPPFLRAVRGEVALASAARYSAWKLPADKVIFRYKNNHYRWYDTALEGQIGLAFYQQNWQVRGLRTQIMPRWYHQWFGVPRDSR
ncbi:ComEC family protein [Erwinia pyri]|uniref:ComEC family protein n=1 Tax=Erwinia pyri TaxID=3062598 RepID=A0AA50DGE1_9GAMM|nr:ComEC family protein [Erwinia sp. DE2]WLS77592.1 ComEC family protein [Erwinia sp. DE2]